MHAQFQQSLVVFASVPVAGWQHLAVSFAILGAHTLNCGRVLQHYFNGFLAAFYIGFLLVVASILLFHSPYIGQKWQRKVVTLLLHNFHITLKCFQFNVSGLLSTFICLFVFLLFQFITFGQLNFNQLAIYEFWIIQYIYIYAFPHTSEQACIYT